MWRRDLANSEPLISDHTVLGRFIMPGVCWLEMVLEASGNLPQPVQAFRNVSFLGPLQCPSGVTTHAELRLDPNAAGFEFVGRSRAESSADNHMVDHVRGTALTGPRDPAPRVGLKAISESCSEPTPSRQR